MPLDDAQLFLPDIWASHARYFSGRTAVACGDTRLTWEQFGAAVNRVANRLGDMGVGRGNCVAVLMTNSADMLVILCGIVRAGACVVPVSALLTGEQVCRLISDSGAVAVFASASLVTLIEDGRGALPALRGEGLILHGGNRAGWQPYDDWIAGSSAAPPGVTYAMEDRFNIIYSSGTTGLPKGIVQTHRARQHWSYSNAIEMGFARSSVALTTTSLYSNGTWLMVLPTLFVGGTLVIMDTFTPSGFLDAVAREGVTHSFMVPTQYIMTMADPAFDGADLSSLRVMLSAGSTLRPDTKRDILARMTPNLYELYGTSEGLATMIKPEDSARAGSVGTPVLGFEIDIIDDAGTPVPPGQAGEIVGYGAGLMAAYHNRPDETEAIIWRDGRGRSFIRTGDIGRVDADGFLYILDRKKDMIVSGGFNVFPGDIEAVVAGHPGVRDVAVIAVPHDKWGETPLALVIPDPDTGADAEAILAWANDRLAKTQRLAGVEFRDDFPRNALGKVLKRVLRDPYWQQA